MGKNKYGVILQVCVCLWLPLCQADCVYKECYCSTVVIACSGKNLQAIPQLDASVTGPGWDLDFNTNNISSIPDGSLPWNLTNLDLQENPIATIDDNAFDDSVTTLASLYLATVHFTKIPSAFGHLRALSDLSINGANITDWNDDVWMTLGATLNTLDLENVGITTWPTWTQYCTKLTYLTIAYGSLSTIPDNAFDNLSTNLKSLSLYNNRLTIVPKALSGVTSLQMLYLNQNHITNLMWLPHNSRLYTLSLSNNYISNATHLSQALIPFNESLNTLNIYSNFLTSIPDFSLLTNLIGLDFSHNRIFDSVSGAAAANTYSLDLSYNSLSLVPRIFSTLILVTDMMLSYNTIKLIQHTDFPSQTTLLDLGYNLVTELTDTSFPENFGLNYLQLNNNPLTTLSPVALQHLPHLYMLNLIATKITRLPLGLSYLTSLLTLDVTNSTELVCTCMESSLTAWVVQRDLYTIRGNCGSTSVSDFFNMLSPFCPTGGTS